MKYGTKHRLGPILIFALCACALLAVHCIKFDFDNPLDPANPKTLTVTRSPADGGTTYPAGRLENIAAGTRVSINAVPGNNYKFVNWEVTDGKAEIADENSESTTVLMNWGNAAVRANFERLYTITYNINGGDGTAPAAQTVNAGSSVTLAGGSGFSRTGYTFGGWNTDLLGTGTDYGAGSSYTPSGNITLYAVWNVITYTVTYDVNDGSGTVPAAQTVNAGSSVTLAGGGGLTRTGYTFSGWNTNSSGTGTNYNAGSSYTPAGDVTLYAKWTELPPNPFTDSRDGQEYRWVLIGSQIWMAENLNYDTLDGTGSWCYGNSADSCTKYGRLYNWNTAMAGSSSSALNPSGVQGVCPVDWHLPSRAEWDQLMTAVGGSSTAGKKLKSQTGWYNNNGTDDYGFSALPGGGRNYSGGSFDNAGSYGSWWGAAALGSSYAYGRYMYYNFDYVYENNYNKDYGFSVRCLR